ncbi:hypothetical protein RJ639_011564, partial [Escallonia herrerae]
MVHFSKRLASKGLEVPLVATTKSDCFVEGGQKTDSHAARFDHFRMAVSRGCPVKLVMYESVVPRVLDTAHQLGLYGAAFFTQSCAVCTIYYHEHQGSLQNDPSEGST